MSPFPLLFFALSFLLTLLRPATATASPPVELLSLLSIKSYVEDPLGHLQTWVLSLNDSSTTPWCTWSGIKCSRQTGQVTSLNLSGRNLSGTVHPDIKNLIHLHHLNLSFNSFSGQFPAAVFRLPNLKTLDINHNNFTDFPPGVSSMKSLTLFNAYSNSLTGPLPEEFGALENLEVLSLGGNYFSGSIPAAYGRLSNLKKLLLQGCLLTGPIPAELGFMKELQRLEIGYNSYTGSISPQFSNLSNLIYLDISNSNLSGNLPEGLGRLSKLQNMLLFRNRLSGPIPESLSGMESLQVLDLSDNYLSGRIPIGLSSLKNLLGLSLMKNNLTGEIPEGLGELPSLRNFSVWENSLTGILPQKLGSNAKLEIVDVSSNFLTGPVPPDLCLGNNLHKLLLFSNTFSGEIPSSLANCTSLVRLRIFNNRLNGSIPYGFGSLPNITFVDFSMNNLSGPIPDDLANGPRLEYLNIAGNSFSSPLPGNVWKAPYLKVFQAGSAGITGKIPNFEGCASFYSVDLSGNNLDGDIPGSVNHCHKLMSFNLRRNSLTGMIPIELTRLPSLQELDLSHNYLTGPIPRGFTSLRTLENFNVSYNRLTGPVPASGEVFSTLHSSSFIGNGGLCGPILAKACPNDEELPQLQRPKKTAGVIVWIIVVAFSVVVLLLLAGRFFRGNFDGKFRLESGHWETTAFQRLNFTIDDVLECLNKSENVIGMGSTGTVYKAKTPCGEIIAVKKLWRKQKDAFWIQRGVLAEVDILGKVRHRNVVRLLGCCNNNEYTLLFYEYMPNGSLDDLLHGKHKGATFCANWVTRYNIAMGVAQGICYLHHDCDPPIVHRDLKPCNILLDEKMEARVADFGLAKWVHRHESMSIIAGSYGYIAPEYAYTLQVDERSDVYSYGVVLMELLTGRRSVESEFGEGNCVVDWVKARIRAKDALEDVFDRNACVGCSTVIEEMAMVLKIALLCTSRNPGDRPSMRDVVSMLEAVRPMRKVPGGNADTLELQKLNG